MGWSCTAAAGDVMNRIFDLNGEDGLLEHNGKKYFCEPSHKEYMDGRIVMEVWEVIGVSPDGKMRCRSNGTFTIKADGGIATRSLNRFPFLKKIFQS
jgi:uncharacterized pyridoxamine 5'-phosphate oxidase family protein